MNAVSSEVFCFYIISLYFLPSSNFTAPARIKTAGRLSVPALPAVLIRAGEERLGEGARYGL